jgi:RNA polymerase sigma-70 factor (ECF subfamily)
VGASPLTADREQRFEAFFRRHYGAAMAYALRRAPEEIAHEAVADAFLVAWRRFDSVRSPDLPWLLGVTRRTLANQLRGERRRLRLRVRVADSGTFAPAGDPTLHDQTVISALRRLPEHEREALLLIAWEGLNPREAACVAGCTAVAFRVRLHRARRQLRRELGDPGDALHPQPYPRPLGEAP